MYVCPIYIMQLVKNAECEETYFHISYCGEMERKPHIIVYKAESVFIKRTYKHLKINTLKTLEMQCATFRINISM